MKVDVYNIEGKKSGQVDLPEDFFGVEPNEHVVYLAVKQYLAAQRQGTHKAKERGEIKGSTRKIKKQKGTGTARAGSIKNPLFVGGGRVFGPRPRKYNIKLNKKVKELAKKSVLSSKLADKSLFVVEDFDIDTPKTKTYQSFLTSIDALDAKSVHITSGVNENVYLSSRNLPQALVVPSNEFNVYDAMNSKYVILSKSAVEDLTKTV